MMSAGVGNRSAATKRLMKEYAEIQSSPNYQYTAAPLEDNIFDWHFTIRGPEDSEFENGIYHGRIVLPPQYPYKPPSIYFLTPNGRFELGKKICLSITGYHPETWLPAWGIRTALIALISFMTTEGKDAVGALDYTPEERRILAKKSHSWHCEQCGCKNSEQLLPIPKKKETKKEDKEDSKLAEMLVVSHDKKNDSNNTDEQENNEKTETTKDTSETPIDVNNLNIPKASTDSIPVTNQSEESKPINSTPTINHNTNSVEVNATSVQQRVTSSSSSNSTTTTTATTSEAVKPQVTNNNTNTNNNSASSSQTNLNAQANLNRNNISEERYKSFIDTLIIVVFSLLFYLMYNRSTKDNKFWNDME
jgi:ubiquitin-protein ligase